ncbi:hypothetical protein [Leptolyngbya sp. Heron Island J]|uniref:hypothetical protein n=1 Tax=Leptolyngbya sp. Heron Island J TaxID=1385935 RepID=UPI00190FA605|nr:hypothetical protein [Leptolyngbya sp. Heron Island J]
MSSCPCCSGNLLRHVRAAGIYWMCLRCRQEMPLINGVEFPQHYRNKTTYVVERA